MGCQENNRTKHPQVEWKLQDAKNRFSELFERALVEGPQVVSRRGTSRVVVVAYDDYDCLTRPQGNLVDFFRESPFAGADLNLERIRDFPDDIQIGD